MEKILIISYFFPPSRFTAASRPFAWFKYLHLFGYYPIIVTVDWEAYLEPEKVATKYPKVVVEKEGEVHFVPLHPSIKEQASKLGFKASPIGKAFTFLELVLQNFSLAVLPYRELFAVSDQLLSSNPTIRILIASANPYPLFFIASRLGARYPHLCWIADYRDDWSTKRLNRQSSYIYKLVYSLEARSERKWLASSVCFISVSELLIQRIAAFIAKPGYLVANGYFEEDYLLPTLQKELNTFVICYSGTLYPEQDLERFLDVYRMVRKDYQDRISIELRFIGAEAYPPGARRLRAAVQDLGSLVEVYPMVSREKCIQLEANSDMLLMMAYGSEKGIPTSKLFQYIGHRIPIMVYPGDDDVIDAIVSDETKLGQRLRGRDQAISFLIAHLEAKLSAAPYPKVIDPSYIYRYSRRAQTELLAGVLRSISLVKE